MDSARSFGKLLVTSTRSSDAIWSMGVNSNDAKNFTKSHIEPVVGIGKWCGGWWWHGTIACSQVQNARCLPTLENARIYWLECHCGGGRCKKSQLCPCSFFQTSISRPHSAHSDKKIIMNWNVIFSIQTWRIWKELDILG
jgi:hypothetical protein